MQDLERSHTSPKRPTAPEESLIHTYHDKHNGQVNIYKPKLPKNKRTEGGFYDHNAPVSLSFSEPVHRPSDRFETPTFSLSNESDYYVEPFDEVTPVTEAPPPTNPPQSSDTEKEKTTQKPEKAIVIQGPDQEPLPVTPPPAEKMPVMPGDIQDDTTPMDDAAFAKELQAILQGQKQYDATQKQTVPVEERPRREPKKPARSQLEEELDPKNEHSIFEKIAQSMELASSYDLGSISLENRFDAFDQEMEKAEVNKKKVADIEEPEIIREIPKQPKAAPLSTTNFLQDMNQIAQAQSAGLAFSNDIPLSPSNGGRLIGEQEQLSTLEIGDLILSTTDDPNLSGIIRKTTQLPVSYASVYIGDGKVFEMTELKSVIRPLPTALMDDRVTVALRHQHSKPEKAKQIKAWLEKPAESPNQMEQFARIQNVTVRIDPAYCASLKPGQRDKCLHFAGRLFLGTANNSAFYCAQRILSVFQEAGLQLTNTTPQWTTPEDVIQLHYNDSLRYVGHLKIM